MPAWHRGESDSALRREIEDAKVAARVLEYLRVEGPDAAGDTGDALGVPEYTVRRALRALVNDGLVAEEPTGTWGLTRWGQRVTDESEVL